MKLIASNNANAHQRVERVRAELERMILSGELSPGDRLNELALSEQFSVSRGPIREVVRALEGARLVQVIHNRGAFVRRVELREALELFEIRSGFARTAGRLLARRADQAQIKKLQNLHHRLDGAAATHNRTEFHRLNLRFHDLLMAFTGNPRLCEMDLSIRNELQLYLRRNVSNEAQLRVSNAEHGAILQAITTGDAETAARAFEAHVLNGKQRLLDCDPGSPD